MAEKRITYKIQELGGIGEVNIADEVITVVAALAATEVDGVASLAGNITHEQVGKVAVKSLAKGVRVSVNDGMAVVDLNLSMSYGKDVQETCRKVQDKVKSSIENMTGLKVEEVNIHIPGIEMPAEDSK